MNDYLLIINLSFNEAGISRKFILSRVLTETYKEITDP